MRRTTLLALATAFLVAAPLDARAQAPSSLQATVSGNLLTLTWQPPTTPPSGYLIEGGTGPGLANLGTVQVPASPTSVGGVVPNGTYFLRVRGIFGGVAGPASNEVAVTVGCTGPPSAPQNLAATVTGQTLALSWAPPATGTGPFTYTLQAGTTSGASNLGTLSLGGATSVSAPVPNGTYFFRVVATNACGTSVSSNEVVAQVGAVGTPLLTFSVVPNPVPFYGMTTNVCSEAIGLGPVKTWLYYLQITNQGTAPFVISSFSARVVSPFGIFVVPYPAIAFELAFGGSTIAPQASRLALLCSFGNWEPATLQWTFNHVGGASFATPVISFLRP